MGKYYLTTTLPYVNAAPHLGFAQEMVEADAIARFRRLQGDEVIFNTGTDEHGLKIYRKALEEGKDPQAYTDEYAAKFEDLKKALNLSYTHFIRTTNEHHKKAAQEFWKRCAENDDIYKKLYNVKYCVGCELEKTDKELVNGKCPIHPNLEVEHIEEENYFFRFSKYQDQLLKLYENTEFVIPDFRLAEIKQFVSSGLQDFSISRLKAKMPWGVPVPGDDEHVMYVWFDALVNYVSTLGWPDDQQNFEDFWPGYQIAGKDNLRQQSAMWQAMLMSAGLPASKQILIHGFVISNGQKMSKSLGNVIDPYEVVDKYGTDAVRFFILHDMQPFEDSDITADRMQESYTANMANGLGNLIARIAKLAEKINFTVENQDQTFLPSVAEKMKEYRFNEAMDLIWAEIASLDKKTSDTEPWKLEETQLKEFLTEAVTTIRTIAVALQPFLPETADKILQQYSGQIKAGQPLFPRIA